LNIWRETKGDCLPACKQPCGCPIEDTAADDEVRHFIDRFFIAKSLQRATGLPEIQRRIFKELGLLDDEMFLLEVEINFRKLEKAKETIEEQDIVKT
jgi:hypothetical protein